MVTFVINDTRPVGAKICGRPLTELGSEYGYDLAREFGPASVAPFPLSHSRSPLALPTIWGHILTAPLRASFAPGLGPWSCPNINPPLGSRWSPSLGLRVVNVGFGLAVVNEPCWRFYGVTSSGPNGAQGQ